MSGRGRVPSEGHADFLSWFWGTTGFFNVMMQKSYFVFSAALLHKKDFVMTL